MVDLDEERAWIVKSQQGDLEAFEALIKRYQHMIHSLTFRMTGSAADSGIAWLLTRFSNS